MEYFVGLCRVTPLRFGFLLEKHEAMVFLLGCATVRQEWRIATVCDCVMSIGNFNLRKKMSLPLSLGVSRTPVPATSTTNKSRRRSMTDEEGPHPDDVMEPADRRGCLRRPYRPSCTLDTKECVLQKKREESWGRDVIDQQNRTETYRSPLKKLSVCSSWIQILSLCRYSEFEFEIEKSRPNTAGVGVDDHCLDTCTASTMRKPDGHQTAARRSRVVRGAICKAVCRGVQHTRWGNTVPAIRCGSHGFWIWGFVLETTYLQLARPAVKCSFVSGRESTHAQNKTSSTACILTSCHSVQAFRQPLHTPTHNTINPPTDYIFRQQKPRQPKKGYAEKR
jgi:hypothetical protein